MHPHKPRKRTSSITRHLSPLAAIVSAYMNALRFVRLILFSKFSIALFLMFAVVPLSAFEAHILNVTADIVNIDPPVISPPGGQYSEPVDIVISDDDPDATHIFYTITPGTDPDLAPDPECGSYPGGAKPLGPIAIEDDAVVKAIACDSDMVGAHESTITTEIYDLNLEGKIEGRKYHDLDKSGTLTNGDVLLQGWRVELVEGTSTTAVTATDANGYYTFNGLLPGSYIVQEEMRSGWQQITPGMTTISISGGETETVNFFNFDTGFSCVPQTINFPARLAVQASGETFGNDDVGIANNVTVNGDVRSNDEIESIGGNGPRTINGNATSVNAISSGITITGASSTGAATAPLPDAMIDFWRARAQEGGTVNGSFTFPNNTVGLVMGPTEIMGNLTLGSSNGLTVKGPIYVHGNFTVGSNSTITQDAGFGNQFTTIIVDGEINIDSNITFNGAGSTGTFLLVSTHEAITGSNAAIETSSNNSDLGDVVLYASEGDIHINQNRTLLAVFATHGTNDDDSENAAIRIDQNVTVNYRTLPTTASCGPRQPLESTSHVLINEFMPNPSGSDTGAAGAPLDGEWVELFNSTPAQIDVAGYVLYDNNNTRALPITVSNINTGSTIIPSGGYIVVYRNGDSDFELNNSGGDTVRLFSGLIGSGGTLVDSHTYTRDAPENKSFARIPDGSANWIDPSGTPGESNNYFFEPLDGGDLSPAFDPPQMPPLVIVRPLAEINNEPVAAQPAASPEAHEEPAPADVPEETESETQENASSTEEAATELGDENSSSTEPVVVPEETPGENPTSTPEAAPVEAGQETPPAPAEEPMDPAPQAEDTSQQTTPDNGAENPSAETPVAQ